MRIPQGVKNRELYAKRLTQFEEEVGVYPVSCEKLAAGRSDLEWLDQVVTGGARIVQLRDKESNDRELLAKARYFRKKTSEAGVLFFLNDRLDIALLSDADGMHVGQKDLPAEEIRKLAPDILIGHSCNTEEQTQILGKAVEQNSSAVSYYNIGPLFETGTKEGLHHFLGAEGISIFSKHCSLPFTVMGGIKLQHLDAILASGAKRVAVVTAINQAVDMAAETAIWQQRIKGEGNAH